MVLYIVGGGLSCDYLTKKAVEVLKSADKIYIDSYTSIAPGIDNSLAQNLGINSNRIIIANREMLENRSHLIIYEAETQKVAVLVPGDPLIATTHISLVIEAKRRNIEVEIIPGVSGIYASIALSGLQFYRFGKPVTLVYPDEPFIPYTTLTTVKENKERNLHTLILLDLRLDEGKAMTVPEAVQLLLDIEEKMSREGVIDKPVMRDSIIVGIARAGLPDFKCIAGAYSKVKNETYPPPPHSLIITAPRLHPTEREALTLLCNLHEEQKEH